MAEEHAGEYERDREGAEDQPYRRPATLRGNQCAEGEDCAEADAAER